MAFLRFLRQLDNVDNTHVLRMRGRCLSRQIYVDVMPPGRSSDDQMAQAAEDALAQCSGRPVTGQLVRGVTPFFSPCAGTVVVDLSCLFPPKSRVNLGKKRFILVGNILFVPGGD